MDDGRNSQITQRGCSHPGPGDMVLANAGLDAFELAVLEVSRLSAVKIEAEMTGQDRRY